APSSNTRRSRAGSSRKALAASPRIVIRSARSGIFGGLPPPPPSPPSPPVGASAGSRLWRQLALRFRQYSANQLRRQCCHLRHLQRLACTVVVSCKFYPLF